MSIPRDIGKGEKHSEYRDDHIKNAPIIHFSPKITILKSVHTIRKSITRYPIGVCHPCVSERTRANNQVRNGMYRVFGRGEMEDIGW